MADSKIAAVPPPISPRTPPPRSVSPSALCAICLGSCSNKCFSDSCLHEFCFKCLLEWSKIKAECPLCKKTFKSIIHNVKSLDEYDEHIVETVQTEQARFQDAIPQYHFRTTFTMNTHGELALQEMLLRHPLLHISDLRNEQRVIRRMVRNDTSATTFRRSIYAQDLWVVSPPDVTGRFRECGPTFFRNNPAARTRLVPWLNRELNALLYENTQQVMHLVDIIMNYLQRHHIYSFGFRLMLRCYLTTKTDHFIHEFYNFMRSPFDMIGYDRHVVYTGRRPASTPSDDYDDVILVSDTDDVEEQPRPEPITDPVVIDLLESDSNSTIVVSDSDEEGVAAPEAAAQEEPARPTVLPLKLRLKLKQKSKHRSWQILSVSGSSSSSSSSSGSSLSSAENEVRRRSKKAKKKRVKRKRAKRHEEGRQPDVEDESSESRVKKVKIGSDEEERKVKEEVWRSDSSLSDFRPVVRSTVHVLRQENAAGTSRGERGGASWFSRVPVYSDSDNSD